MVRSACVKEKETTAQPKGVVYQATCKTCVDSVPSRTGEIYIGETTRQVGTRFLERG